MGINPELKKIEIKTKNPNANLITRDRLVGVHVVGEDDARLRRHGGRGFGVDDGIGSGDSRSTSTGSDGRQARVCGRQQLALLVKVRETASLEVICRY